MQVFLVPCLKLLYRYQFYDFTFDILHLTLDITTTILVIKLIITGSKKYIYSPNKKKIKTCEITALNFFVGQSITVCTLVSSCIKATQSGFSSPRIEKRGREGVHQSCSIGLAHFYFEMSCRRKIKINEKRTTKKL